ncbi:hypothetical protein V8F33_014186 [Rhypophila sp. PSN 637]
MAEFSRAPLPLNLSARDALIKTVVDKSKVDFEAVRVYESAKTTELSNQLRRVPLYSRLSLQAENADPAAIYDTEIRPRLTNNIFPINRDQALKDLQERLNVISREEAKATNDDAFSYRSISDAHSSATAPTVVMTRDKLRTSTAGDNDLTVLFRDFRNRYLLAPAAKNVIVLAHYVDLFRRENDLLKAKVQDNQETIAHLVFNARQQTPGNASVLTIGHGGKRSTKIPDPEAFHNDKTKDKVAFDVFYDSLLGKLEANADHWDNDRGKFQDHPDRIVTSEELLKHLHGEYHDHTRAEKALEEYDRLTMKDGYDFDRFKNDFLPASLRTPLAPQYIDKTITFASFARIAQEIAHAHKAAAAAAKRTNPTTTNNKASGGRPPTPANAGSQRPTRRPGRTGHSLRDLSLSTKDIEDRYTRGLCFNCKEPGHIAKDCPKPNMRASATSASAIEQLKNERAAKLAKLMAFGTDAKPTNEQEN